MPVAKEGSLDGTECSDTLAQAGLCLETLVNAFYLATGLYLMTGLLTNLGKLPRRVGKSYKRF